MPVELLCVRGLVKEYGGSAGVRVLDGIEFTLAAGEALVVMGPSGSGKSTLLNILGALDAPSAGEVLFEGRPIHALSEREAAEFRNRSIGFVFQEHHLLPQCTALENVLLPCLAFGRAGSTQLERGRRLLEAVGLAGKQQRFPAELSGGEKQRVAIARAMLNAPRLLLCDEPTGNLDADTGRQVAAVFLELREAQRMALVVATHNAEIAEAFGRVRHLKGGRLHG